MNENDPVFSINEYETTPQEYMEGMSKDDDELKSLLNRIWPSASYWTEHYNKTMNALASENNPALIKDDETSQGTES